MPNSKENKTLTKIFKTLEKVQKENEHLTPNLNDIYDTFANCKLKIERNEINSEIIIKELKNARQFNYNNKKIILNILIQIQKLKI